MPRLLFPLGLLCFLLSPALADDAPKKGKATQTADKPGDKTSAQKLKDDPNDVKAMKALFDERFAEISALMDDKPDAAEKKLAELKTEAEALTPDAEDARSLLSQAKRAIGSYQDQIELQRTPLADLEKKLDADADDIAALSKYSRKVGQDIMKIAGDHPEKAEEMLAAARKRLTKIEEDAKENPVKRLAANTLKQFTSIERRIEGARKLADLVGKDAAPLAEEIQAWVNGEPLKDGDLKGKVVLLDFWAVWCGPCIATFPHLKEWNEKYSEKGLVIIGLTQYYNFSWNDDTSRATRAKEKVAAEEENEMLRKFAENHSLHHRFAVQKESSSLAEYYAVSGIPHVVLIDQEGKIRLVRVGSGAKNAKDIGETIEKLLAASPDGK